MYRPWHAQVLAAMCRARARGVLPGPAEAYRELQADPDLPRTVAADAVPLASLMEAAPRPEHAPAYASMVVEGGIRRRIHLAGARLVQACEDGDLEMKPGAAAFSAAQRTDLHA
jgi:replicative DNA helicase